MEIIKTSKRAANTVKAVVQAWHDAKAIPGSFVPDIANLVSFVGEAITKEWTTTEAITEGMKASTWIYACVKLHSQAMGSIPWAVYEKGDTERKKPLTNHPLAFLLANPNPYMTQQAWIERTSLHYQLAGNGLTVKLRPSAKAPPAALWPINPDIVTPVPDIKKFIAYYKVDDNIKSKLAMADIPPEDVIHWQNIDPAQPYWGLSPMQAAAKVIDTETASVLWNKNSMDNRIISGGLFSFKNRLNPKQWREASALIAEEYSGAVNARRPMVIGDDVAFTHAMVSPADMDFIQGRKMSREEICAVFQVPPPLVGILDNSTYNNISTARLIFWLDTVLPLADAFEEVLNTMLAVDFPGVEIGYSTIGIQALSQLIAQSIDTATKLFTMGYPVNVINKHLFLGLPNIVGGDIGYLNAGLLPANSMSDVEDESED